MKCRPLIGAAAAACLLIVSPMLPAERPSSARTVPGPDVRSEAALVIDLTDESVQFDRRADASRPIASITKLMTALVVLDGHLPLHETIQITKADRNNGKGSYSRLPVGAKLTRADLLHLALMSSENRAANALGRAYPGGLAAFVRTMNVKAKALGMKRTRFADPSGLSNANVSTARDLAKLVIAAGRQPLIREYSTNPSHVVRVGKQLLQFRNTNALVRNDSWRVAIQKTGYTSAAGNCLVMQADIRDRPTLIVLLNSVGKYTRVADAKRIRQWMEGGSGLRTAPAMASFPSR